MFHVHRVSLAVLVVSLLAAAAPFGAEAQQQVSGDTTVYINRRNRDYHMAGCPELGSTGYRAIDIKDAVARGYKPHGLCEAPTFLPPPDPRAPAASSIADAAPFVLPAGEFEAPTLLESSARWTAQMAGSVSYEWNAAVSNPNAVDLPVVVILRLHDANDEVIHEAQHIVEVAARTTNRVTQSGSLAESIAGRGSSWSFEVQLPRASNEEDAESDPTVVDPEPPVVEPDPTVVLDPEPPVAEPDPQPAPAQPQATSRTSQAAEDSFRARAGRLLGGIVPVVFTSGARQRVTSYRISGDRLTLTLFSGGTQVSSMATVDFSATIAAWAEEEQRAAARAATPQRSSSPQPAAAVSSSTVPEYDAIDGGARAPIRSSGPYLEWFRGRIDRAFMDSFNAPSLLSDGAPSCAYVDANPTDIYGGDVCVARYRMSASRTEWPEVEIRVGANFEGKLNEVEADFDDVLRQMRASNIDVSDIDAPGLRMVQLNLLSKVVRLTLSDARADGVSVGFVRASEPQFDDFGQPVAGDAEPYWSFAISRGIAARINWENFDTEAWPRVADDFTAGVFSAESSASTAAPASTPREPSGGPLDIIDVSTRVTERNDSWWRFAWILVLRNNTSAPISASATIEFVDADGFVIDEDNEYRLGVPANSQREFTGSKLVSMPGAGNVSGVRAKAGARDAAPSTPSPASASRPPSGGASSPGEALRLVLTERDARNAGIDAIVRQPEPGVLDFSIQDISGEKSMADVFRVFLQFAEALQNDSYSAVYLAFRGERRFLVTGEYFQKLGREFQTQNAVYTTRTFPSQLQDLQGSAAFPTWTGGLIGVVGKQMEDFQKFHRQWYLNDLLGLSD